jgi:hypothetical protein
MGYRRDFDRRSSPGCKELHDGAAGREQQHQWRLLRRRYPVAGRRKVNKVISGGQFMRTGRFTVPKPRLV